MRHLLPVLVFSLLLVPHAAADQLPDGAREHLQEYLEKRDRAELLDVTATDMVSVYIWGRDRLDDIRLADVRQDLQRGSLSGRGSSTSVVARPGLTDLLSAALESGAVGRKTNDDQSITFSVNALPLGQALSGEIPRGCGSMDGDCRTGPGRWLRGLGASVTLSPSSGTTPIPDGGGSASQAFRLGGRTLQVATVRYELLVRERNGAKVQEALDEMRVALQDGAAAFLKVEAAFEKELDTLLEAGWRQATVAALERSAGSLERLEAVLLRQYQMAYDIVRGSPAAQTLRAAAAPATIAYISAQNQLLAEQLYRKALTFDYLHERPSDQPELHQARLVFSTPLGRKASALAPGADPLEAAPAGMLTLNGGVSFFQPGTAEPAEWKARDSQVSIGLDWSPRVGGRLRPTYTAAYYFQYMLTNGVLQFTGDAVTPGGAVIALPGPAQEVLDTKGAIHVAQLRASFSMGNGVSFPIAVSYSNRSELITGRAFWQGHFGVTYDFSQLRKLVANP